MKNEVYRNDREKVKGPMIEGQSSGGFELMMIKALQVVTCHLKVNK